MIFSKFSKNLINFMIFSKTQTPLTLNSTPLTRSLVTIQSVFKVYTFPGFISKFKTFLRFISKFMTFLRFYLNFLTF